MFNLLAAGFLAKYLNKSVNSIALASLQLMFNLLKLSNSHVIVDLLSLLISASFEDDLSPIAKLTVIGRKILTAATTWL